MAAIEERRELVQALWFFGHDEEGASHYEGLWELRRRYEEMKDAHTGLNNPGAHDNSPEV
jgi:hypothetical protein